MSTTPTAASAPAAPLALEATGTAAPEPGDVDETTSMALRVLAAEVNLKGHEVGAERCDGCAFYLEPTSDLSYCWHPALRILVGGGWWCACWENADEGASS